MSDRELIRLAAKAAGHELIQFSEYSGFQILDEGDSRWWDPLKEDGDALRLAVKLRLTIDRSEIGPVAFVYCDWQDTYVQALEKHGNDPYAATRRAITRAAAEIGKHLEKNNGN